MQTLSPMLRRYLYVAAICAGLCGLAGCNNAPTLPLPPPLVEVSTPSVQGLVVVQGEVGARAYVSIFNARIEAGVITRADLAGRFLAEIEAASGDVLTVWAEIDGEVGERREIEVPPAR